MTHCKSLGERLQYLQHERRQHRERDPAHLQDGALGDVVPPQGRDQPEGLVAAEAGGGAEELTVEMPAVGDGQAPDEKKMGFVLV